MWKRKELFFAVCILVCLCGIIAPLAAQSGELAPPPEQGLSDSPGGDQGIIFDDPLPAVPAPIGGVSSTFVVIRMLLVLALAALAIYGVVFCIKRLARPQEGRDPHLKLLARVPLSADTFAAVVSLGGKAWLLGGASGGVTLIAEVTDPETLETLLLDEANKSAAAGGQGMPSFLSLLRRFGKNASPPAAESTLSGSFAARLRAQRERLTGQ
jgi:flagellar protein FliO/FliZ